jgi:hypothetical protein
MRRFQIVIAGMPVLGGVLSGVGVLTLLQQSGSVYPTRNVLILSVVLGALWGTLLPTLARTRALRAAARR